MYWIGTEYFKHVTHSPFFLIKMQLSHNSKVFGSCVINILYIYSTNIGTEYFKHGIYSPFFFTSKCSLSHNPNVIGSCIIHILYIYSTNIVLNILKMVYILLFFSSKCSLFHNSNVFWFLGYSHFIYLFNKYRYWIF